ncbi:TolC family protein [Tumidithrix elongata RA019]|uniref:TolC family protein n=1 Tax=Tumidithrix elongata BACA0141 TaxID=2716417 RepID=A0AAW9Q8R3_9CYAN|nr:TolC family protein [Tumidithrix elongata RA019]
MQISFGWMTLSASLAILTPTLSANAQVNILDRTPANPFVSSQVSTIIVGSIPQTIPISGSVLELSWLAATDGSRVEVPLASLFKTLLSQITDNSAQTPSTNLTTGTQVPLENRSNTKVTGAIVPVANRNSLPTDRLRTKTPETILASLPLREIQLSSKPSYFTAQEPDTLETHSSSSTAMPPVAEVTIAKPKPALLIRPSQRSQVKPSEPQAAKPSEPAAKPTSVNLSPLQGNGLREINTSTQPTTKVALEPASDLPTETTAKPTESGKPEVRDADAKPTVKKPVMLPLGLRSAVPKPIASKPISEETSVKVPASSSAIAAPETKPALTPAALEPKLPVQTEQKLSDLKAPESKPVAKPTTTAATPAPATSTQTKIEPTPQPATVTSGSETHAAQLPTSSLALEPAQTLVVPTTPSQVKLDRTKPISLNEAIELANKTNRDIIQARIAVDRARAALREQEAAKLPTIDATLQYNFTDSAQVRLGNVAAPFLTPPANTITQPVTGTVGVQYNIFNSGLVDANIRAAENLLRIKEADLNRITQVVRLNIATAYYQLQNTDENVRIQLKAVENAERSLKDTQALERAGAGTKFDVLQSEVQLANAQQNLLNARANQLIARRDMSRQLEYPATLDLSAADKIEPAQDWKPTLEDTIILAVRNRSDLDILKLQREVARDRIVAAFATLGPQVNLSANLNAADNFNQIGGVALGYQLGATVQWSLFDGGKAQAQADQFKADQALAESQFEQTARQIRFDVEQAYITLLKSREQITTATRALTQANEALRLARLRLTAGVGTQLEVINAEVALTQADVNRLQAITGFNLSLSTLQRAINGL